VHDSLVRDLVRDGVRVAQRTEAERQGQMTQDWIDHVVLGKGRLGERRATTSAAPMSVWHDAGMRIAVLSDLHVSRYGDTNEATAIPGRPWIKMGGDVVDKGVFWRTAVQDGGWKIQQNRVDLHWRVVDPDGIRRATNATDQASMERQVRAWRIADARALIHGFPSSLDMIEALTYDPTNTNLRLVQARRALDALSPRPDWVVLCGDQTDNGYGYYLIDHVLRPWVEERRLLVVPGNHDINKTLVAPLGYSFRMEPGTYSRDEKVATFWRWFEAVTGQHPFPEGVSRPVPLADGVFFIGIDSIKDNSSFFGQFAAVRNAIGEVSQSSLQRLKDVIGDIRRDARCIIVALHHHVLWKGLARTMQFETLMSLRNAEATWEVLKDLRVDLVLNGHRHYSYYRDDLGPNAPRLLSSPSTTLGDARSGKHFFWTVDVTPEGLRVEEVTLPT